MKKVICFARVSSLHQDLTPQLTAVKREILRDGYKEDEILVVKGKESAIKLKEEERQTLNEMKQMIEDYPTIEAVYFFAVDRLARRMSVIMSVKEWADEHKINLVFLNPQLMKTWRRNEKGELEKDKATDLYLLLLSYGAQMEMQIKQERFKEAKAIRRQQNKVTGSLSFGYTTTNDGTITINKDEAKVIEWVFNCYLIKGMSLNQIYNEGVELGYWASQKSRTGGASKIRHILLNKQYCGKPYGKFSLTYPIIIDEDKIDAATKLMSEKKKGEKVYTSNIYYAKSILRDEETNTILIADRNHIKYTAANANTKYGVNMNVADTLIWKSAIQTKFQLLSYSDDNAIEETKNTLSEVSTKIVNLSNYIDREINPQMDRNYNAYIKGRISEETFEIKDDDFKKQLESTRKKIQALEKREIELSNVLAELTQKETNDIDITTLEDIKDDKQRKEIIDECIENMTVRKINDNWYLFKVYNKISNEADIYLYIPHGGTKTELYEVLAPTEVENFQGTIKDGVESQVLIDISNELEIRYVRTNK